MKTGLRAGRPAESSRTLRSIDLAQQERGMLGAVAASVLVGVAVVPVDAAWAALGMAVCLAYGAAMRFVEALIRSGYGGPTSLIVPERKALIQQRWPDLYADLTAAIRRRSVSLQLLLVAGLSAGLWVFLSRVYREAAPADVAVQSLWLLYFLPLHRLAEHRPARIRHITAGLAMVELSLLGSDWVLAAGAGRFLALALPQALWVALLSAGYYVVAHTLALWWDAFTHLDVFVESAQRSLSVLHAGDLVQRLVEDLQATFGYQRVLVLEPGRPAMVCVSASDLDLVGQAITESASWRSSHPSRAGVFSRVAETQRFHCTNDTEAAAEDYVEAAELPGVRSQLVQPVLMQDGVAAFLVAQSFRRRAFTLRDKHVLGIAATLIGQLMSAAESDRYAQSLGALVRDQLAAASPAAAAKRVAEAAVGTYQAAKALVYLHLGGTTFDGPYAAAAGDAWLPAPRQAAMGAESPLGKAMLAGEVARYDRALAAPDELDAEGQWPYLDASGPAVADPLAQTRARVTLRLEAAGQCLGIAYLYFRPPRAFLQADRARLEDLAQLAAEAIACPSGGDRSANPAGLTPREREVAALVGAGLTNPQIAEELTRRGTHISATTVSGHVSSILAKLGEQRRAAIGRHVPPE